MTSAPISSSSRVVMPGRTERFMASSICRTTAPATRKPARSSGLSMDTGAPLQHPSAADVQDLTGNVVGGLGGEKFDGGGRAPGGKAGIGEASRFVESEVFFVNIRRVHDVDGDAVLCFLDGERAGKRDNGSFRGGIRGNRGLTESTLGSHRAEIDDAAPALAAHRRENGFAGVKNTEKIRV